MFIAIFLGSFGLFAQTDSDSVYFSPRAALLRSAICPGWGQLYVHKPLKAVLYLGIEVYNLYQVMHFQSIYAHVRDTKTKIGAAEWNLFSEQEKQAAVFSETGYRLEMNSWRPREKRNKYVWWTLSVYLVGMLDAYVDAHLSNFPTKNVVISPDIGNNRLGVRLTVKLSREYGY
jgi:hypothetical protein